MKKWKILNKRAGVTGKIFKHFHVDVEVPQSKQQTTFDIIATLDWVNILALDQNLDAIFVKQYRVGKDQITLELPGGAIERGEDPLIAAKRELQEETGYTSDQWDSLGSSAVNPAFMINDCHFFLASNCKKTHEFNFDEFEEIELELVPEKELVNKIERKEINHSLVELCLTKYFLRKNN